MDWPTDDIESSNTRIAPSKLTGGFKKRKQPDGGFNLNTHHPSGSHTNKLNNTDVNIEDRADDGVAAGESDDEDHSARHTPKKSRTREESASKRSNRDKMLDQATKAVVTEKKSIDPRFMDYAGVYNKKKAEENYAFLDDLRRDEISVLKRAGKGAKDGAKKSEIQRAIQAREEYLRAKDKSQKKDDLLAQYKQSQKEQAKLGVTPQHINEKRLKKQLGVAQDFLSLSVAQVDKRIKHKMERQTNRDKAEFRKQLGGSQTKK